MAPRRPRLGKREHVRKIHSTPMLRRKVNRYTIGLERARYHYTRRAKNLDLCHGENDRLKKQLEELEIQVGQQARQMARLQQKSEDEYAAFEAQIQEIDTQDASEVAAILLKQVGQYRELGAILEAQIRSLENQVQIRPLSDTEAREAELHRLLENAYSSSGIRYGTQGPSEQHSSLPNSRSVNASVGARSSQESRGTTNIYHRLSEWLRYCLNNSFDSFPQDRWIEVVEALEQQEEKERQVIAANDVDLDSLRLAAPHQSAEQAQTHAVGKLRALRESKDKLDGYMVEYGSARLQALRAGQAAGWYPNRLPPPPPSNWPADLLEAAQNTVQFPQNMPASTQYTPTFTQNSQSNTGSSQATLESSQVLKRPSVCPECDRLRDQLHAERADTDNATEKYYKVLEALSASKRRTAEGEQQHVAREEIHLREVNELKEQLADKEVAFKQLSLPEWRSQLNQVEKYVAIERKLVDAGKELKTTKERLEVVNAELKDSKETLGVVEEQLRASERRAVANTTAHMQAELRGAKGRLVDVGRELETAKQRAMDCEKICAANEERQIAAQNKLKEQLAAIPGAHKDAVGCEGRLMNANKRVTDMEKALEAAREKMATAEKRAADKEEELNITRKRLKTSEQKVVDTSVAYKKELEISRGNYASAEAQLQAEMEDYKRRIAATLTHPTTSCTNCSMPETCQNCLSLDWKLKLALRNCEQAERDYVALKELQIQARVECDLHRKEETRLREEMIEQAEARGRAAALDPHSDCMQCEQLRRQLFQHQAELRTAKESLGSIQRELQEMERRRVDRGTQVEVQSSGTSEQQSDSEDDSVTRGRPFSSPEQPTTPASSPPKRSPSPTGLFTPTISLSTLGRVLLGSLRSITDRIRARAWSNPNAGSTDIESDPRRGSNVSTTTDNTATSETKEGVMALVADLQGRAERAHERADRHLRAAWRIFTLYQKENARLHVAVEENRKLVQKWNDLIYEIREIVPGESKGGGEEEEEGEEFL